MNETGGIRFAKRGASQECRNYKGYDSHAAAMAQISHSRQY